MNFRRCGSGCRLLRSRLFLPGAPLKAAPGSSDALGGNRRRGAWAVRGDADRRRVARSIKSGRRVRSTRACGLPAVADRLLGFNEPTIALRSQSRCRTFNRRGFGQPGGWQRAGPRRHLRGLVQQNTHALTASKSQYPAARLRARDQHHARLRADLTVVGISAAPLAQAAPQFACTEAFMLQSARPQALRLTRRVFARRRLL